MPMVNLTPAQFSELRSGTRHDLITPTGQFTAPVTPPGWRGTAPDQNLRNNYYGNLQAKPIAPNNGLSTLPMQPYVLKSNGTSYRMAASTLSKYAQSFQNTLSGITGKGSG